MQKKIFLLGIMLSLSFYSFSQQYPYQNPNLTADERASDLVKRLTVEEKVSLMMDVSKAIPLTIVIRRQAKVFRLLIGTTLTGKAVRFRYRFRARNTKL